MQLVQMVVEDESSKNLGQDKTIQRLNEKITILEQNVRRLHDRINELQEHLDNGWRQEFIDMFKRDFYEITVDIVNNYNQINKEQMEKMFDSMHKKYEQMLELDKLKKKRTIIDINKLLYYLFSTGGILYLLITRWFGK
jgi:predicted nuclease with TOPRIM domain